MGEEGIFDLRTCHRQPQCVQSMFSERDKHAKNQIKSLFRLFPCTPVQCSDNKSDGYHKTR